MIEDYRKQLTESLQDELANNKDLIACGFNNETDIAKPICFFVLIGS